MNESITRTTSMVCQLLKVTFLALALAMVGCGGAAADGDSRQHMGEIAHQPGDYEPCGDKVCGDSCTLCAPGDADCFETMVLKTCDADGACTPSASACTEVPADYEPCAGKTCGDTCTVCDPNDPDCVETMVLKTCDPDGACTPSASACTEVPGKYEPCAGKTCGDTCTVCDPNDPDCVETMAVKTCDPDGACTPSASACTEVPGKYEPCAGKTCGDTCTVCDPNDPDCFETMVLKTCDADGACTPSASACMTE